ncbi:MAG: cation:proton antiporter [Candidatus Thermoplasmatota archaeon]|nr:cation:proton antiporter [Candidatus Thermoplasmatota archaeon]
MEAVLYLLLLLISAIFFGKVMEKFGQPTIVGNIIGGLFAGPFFLWILSIFDDHLSMGSVSDMITFLSPETAQLEVFFIIDLSVIMLMFASGMETRIKDFIASFRTGILTAALGIVVPFGFGFLGTYLYLGDVLMSFYVGAALSITAVALSIATLIQIDGIRTRFGMTIINAAIVDDIIGIIILSVILTFSSTGKLPSAASIGITVALSLIFVLASIFLVPKLLKKVYGNLKDMRTTEKVGLGVLMAGLFSVIAHVMGLHLMIGAFLGGMAIRDSLTKNTMQSLSRWSFGFFAPVFFAWVGFSVTLSGLAFSPLVPLLILLGFSGKLLGAGIGAKLSGLTWAESILVGIGMNGKAAVELILASVALQAGIIERDLFSAIVIFAAFMAVSTPIMLKMACRKFTQKGWIEDMY